MRDNRITILLADGVSVSYNSTIEYPGRRIKAGDLDVVVSRDALVYKKLKVAIKNGRHAGNVSFRIRSADGSLRKFF